MEENTVLIVDDEELVLDITSRALELDGYTLLTAKNAQEGLDILDRHAVHLVISDQKMPGMSGLEFLKAVKAKKPDITTIMLTAYADADVAVEAINEAGVYKFVLKPWDTSELRITVKRALELRLLMMERDVLVKRLKEQEKVLKKIEKKYPGATEPA